MAKITEDYVSFETAKLLKEKGFDEDIDLWYDENGDRFFKYHYAISRDWRVRQNQQVYQSPTLQMAMKWLREVHKIHINTVFLGPSLKWTPTIWKIDVTIPESKHLKSTLNTWESYEDAYEAAIKYCLENLI